MGGHGCNRQRVQPGMPATLSRKLSRDLFDAIGFHGLAVSDDMEMHAVSDLGSYEWLAERALVAGSDIVLFCSHIERIPELQRAMSDLVKTNTAVAARVAEAHQKAQAFRDHIARLRANAIPPAKSFD